MSDWAHIYLAYGVAIGAPLLWAVSLVQRARALESETDDRDASWTR